MYISFFLLYYNKQPIETHGMYKVTGQRCKCKTFQKNKDKNRNINRKQNKGDNFK
jgi:hypothetical protein